MPVQRGALQLKVRWRNCTAEDDEWFPFDQLREEYQHLVRAFMEEHAGDIPN